MNWDQVQGKWKQASGKLKEKWGKLTDSDIGVIRGQRDQLVGRIQERYGIVKEEAQKQVEEWIQTVNLGDSPESASSEDEELAAGAPKRRGAGRS